MPFVVSALAVYPIKSTRGIALARARIARRGFEHDRRFMVVGDNSKFLTQRTHPRLALVDVRIAGDHLVISASGAGSITVPLVPEGVRRQVTVWRDTCDAVVVSEASPWFRDWLGITCDLVFMPDDVERLAKPAHALPGDLVGFPDGYPFLLTASASLDDLNTRLVAPVTMERFRPNIVVSGSNAFAEDGWKRIAIGGVPFRVAAPCARCTITTVDPATAEMGVEPLKTLATFRTRDNEVLFGQNLVHDAEGTIEVGAAVEVL